MIDGLLRRLGLRKPVFTGYTRLKMIEQPDGRLRWLMVSSGGFLDRDNEIVSTEFLRSAVKTADASGDRGPLLVWHIPGSIIGACDFQAVVTPDDGEPGFLLESGLFDETPAGQRAAGYYRDKAADYGASIKFLYVNRSETGVYDAPGVILERSILPRAKAAFPWSTIELTEVMNMAQIDKEKRTELEQVIGSDLAAEVIDGLAESSEQLKQAGVAWKEAEAGEMPAEAEAEKQVDAEPTAEMPAEAAEAGEMELVLSDEALIAIGQTVTEIVQTEMAGVMEAFQVLADNLTTLVTTMAEEIAAMRRSDEERIEEKMAHLPRATVRRVQANGVYRPTAAKAAAPLEEPDDNLLARGQRALYGE